MHALFVIHFMSLQKLLKSDRVTDKIQVAQLSQTDHAAGWVSFGRKWKTGTVRQYFTDITGISSTTVT